MATPRHSQQPSFLDTASAPGCPLVPQRYPPGEGWGEGTVEWDGGGRGEAGTHAHPSAAATAPSLSTRPTRSRRLRGPGHLGHSAHVAGCAHVKAKEGCYISRHLYKQKLLPNWATKKQMARWWPWPQATSAQGPRAQFQTRRAPTRSRQTGETGPSVQGAGPTLAHPTARSAPQDWRSL